MTREEAIRMLTRLKDKLNFEDTDSQKKMDALNMAIKNLEAWEKVKEEIESKMISLEGLYSYQKAYHDNCNNARKECLEIIDKHLSEVSE